MLIRLVRSGFSFESSLKLRHSRQMARASEDAWWWGGGRGGVVFRKATIPLGAVERQAVKSEPGRGNTCVKVPANTQFRKQTLTQEHILFSELEKCATKLLAILCKYLTNAEDRQCSQWIQHRKLHMLKKSAEDAHLEGLAGLVFPGNLQGGREMDELSLVHSRFVMRISGLWVPMVPAAGREEGREGGGKDLTFGTCLAFRPWTPWVPRLPFLSQGSGANNLNYRGKDHHTARQGLGVYVIAQTKKHTVFIISRHVKAEKQRGRRGGGGVGGIRKT